MMFLFDMGSVESSVGETRSNDEGDLGFYRQTEVVVDEKLFGGTVAGGIDSLGNTATPDNH